MIIAGKTRETIDITKSREITLNVSDCRQITVNLSGMREFTVNIADSKNYTVNTEKNQTRIEATPVEKSGWNHYIGGTAK